MTTNLCLRTDFTIWDADTSLSSNCEQSILKDQEVIILEYDAEFSKRIDVPLVPIISSEMIIIYYFFIDSTVAIRAMKSARQQRYGFKKIDALKL